MICQREGCNKIIGFKPYKWFGDDFYRDGRDRSYFCSQLCSDLWRKGRLWRVNSRRTGKMMIKIENKNLTVPCERCGHKTIINTEEEKRGGE